jgi:2-polyprenyl-3-methyl-5-hydroxy-6-metoxy-1,4-benzoquinol methylase
MIKNEIILEEDKKKHDVACSEFEDFLLPLNALEITHCSICKSNNFRLINNQCRYGFYYPTGLCLICGNIQQTEYYTQEVLDTFYERFYRRIYGFLSPNDLFTEQKNGRGHRIYNFISPSIGVRVLEVGCGAGGILSVFRDNGAEVLGLDYDLNYLVFARNQGINVRKGSIENVSDNEKFDLIILSHVLEHVRQPIDFLKSLRKHLVPNGVLYVEVPSLEYVCAGGYGGQLINYWQNAHFTHFTLKSLFLVSSLAGFKLVKQNKLIASIWKVDLEGIPMSEGQLKKEYRNSISYNESLFRSIEIQPGSMQYFIKIMFFSIKKNCRLLYKFFFPK